MLCNKRIVFEWCLCDICVFDKELKRKIVVYTILHIEIYIVYIVYRCILTELACLYSCIWRFFMIFLANFSHSQGMRWTITTSHSAPGRSLQQCQAGLLNQMDGQKFDFHSKSICPSLASELFKPFLRGPKRFIQSSAFRVCWQWSKVYCRMELFFVFCGTQNLNLISAANWIELVVVV